MKQVVSVLAFQAVIAGFDGVAMTCDAIVQRSDYFLIGDSAGT